MKAVISLSNLNDGYFEEVGVYDIEDQNHFTYFDNEKKSCRISIYDDGICFFKQNNDYLLELHLKDEAYVKIISDEGILKFDAKVVDFHKNNDILVMHYLVNEEERIIKIKFY